MLETPEEFRRRVGRVEIGPSEEFQGRGDVVRNFVLAVLLVSILVGATAWLTWPELLPLYIGLPAFTVYCAIAYFVRIRPNHDEIGGLTAGLRASDDVNRFLIQLVIVLALGRFVSVGIVDGVRLLIQGRLPHERRMTD